MKLSEYHKKRIFTESTEPKGHLTHTKKNLFVIQKHAARRLHYDFRLELNGVLLSWAVPKGPSLDPNVKRLAVHVEDHPIEYAKFAGVIPAGNYGAGTVVIWDKGKWQSLDTDPVKAIQKGRLHFVLSGKKLQGQWILVRLKKDDDKNWFLIKKKDSHAVAESEYDVVTSDQSDDLAKTNLKLYKAHFPSAISPELCTFVATPPTGMKWLHEIKFDGYRIIAFKNGKQIHLMSRNHKDWSKYFPNVVKQLKNIPIKKAVFDGEIVVLNKQQQSEFQLLQNAIHAGDANIFVYYVFDLLYYDQYNLMSLPLLQRKALLHSIINSKTNSVLRYSDHVIGSGDEIFKKACELALEGVISKSIDSQYQQKRTQSWMKTKCIKRQEFVIGGYTKPRKTRKFFGSLLLGYFNKSHQFIYCGRVGTGFSEDSLQQIFTRLQKYKIPYNPFQTHPPNARGAQWLKPALIAEVEFTDWTDEEVLRQPVFKGLRDDKKSNEIDKEIETPITSEIILPFSFTNPDKILFSENKITKKDLLNYYDQVHEWILPHVANRILTLLRCPNGYQKDCFYQKHYDDTLPNVLHAIQIKSKGKYIYLQDRTGLLALVQLGVLEIHPWGSQVGLYDYPDRIIFDIDPSPDLSWKAVVAAARVIKKHLDEYHLVSFVKSTGGKGLHIVVPIQPEFTWEQVKNFTHIFVNFLAMSYPDIFVSQASKEKRVGKIFVDYLRNQRGATAVAAYSTRARVRAPISTPLDWDELTNRARDTTFTLLTLPARLKSLRNDPWSDFFKIKQSLRLNKI